MYINMDIRDEPFHSLAKCRLRLLQTATSPVRNLQLTATLHIHLKRNLKCAIVKINLDIGTGPEFHVKTCLNYASDPWESILIMHRHLKLKVSEYLMVCMAGTDIHLEKTILMVTHQLPSQIMNGQEVRLSYRDCIKG